MSTNFSATTDPQRPAKSPQVRWWGVLLGLLLSAICVGAVYETYLFYTHPGHPDSLLRGFARVMESPDPVWVGVIGGLAVLLGLWMLYAAIAPRSKPFRRLATTTAPTWIRRVDIARVSTATALKMPGIISASSLVKGHKIRVDGEGSFTDESRRTELELALSRRIHEIFGADYQVSLNIHAAEGSAVPAVSGVSGEEEK